MPEKAKGDDSEASFLSRAGVQRQDNFHNAVKISPTPGNEGQLIHIEYRANMYKGVKHDTKTKEGMLMIELNTILCWTPETHNLEDQG